MDPEAYGNPTSAVNNKSVDNMTDTFNARNYEISVSEEKRQILEWLSPMARERHQAVRKGRVDGVGNWLLETNEFEKWRTSEDQAVNPVLFYYGDPGVGKTYLSSLVIDTLFDVFDRDNVAIACVYCDFHAHKQQSATSVLAALLKQLIAKVELIPKEIKEAFRRAKGKADGRALRLREIHATFIKSVALLRRGFICIDALDEFPTKHRPELWDSLQHIVRECPNIRLFITGRPQIREEIKKYFPGYPDLPAIKPTEEDIGGYLTVRLSKDPEPHAMNAELEADILRIIPDKISGAFLPVSLIMDAILDDVTIHRRRQTLHKMTNGFGLEDVYNATLGRIREQMGNRVKIGMEALMWISFSERPLKAEELRHALAVKVGTTDLDIQNVPSIRTLLSCTLGLVNIDGVASTVRLVHFTLKEYLAAHPSLFTTPHSMMAEICLTYLNFRSVCEISATTDGIPSVVPFLHYASCYWGFHARKEMTKYVKALALEFLGRGADHISAGILLRRESLDLSLRGRYGSARPDLGGFTGLHCIAYMGITEIAVEMIGMGRWDLNGCDSNSATPLLWAAKYGNYSLVKLFLEQGDVDPTLSDKEGLTPLTHAAKSGYEDIVKLLLERSDVNPDPSDNCGRTPLSYAAEYGHAGAVKTLLERGGINPNSTDNRGRTPLSYAAGSGSEGLVKLLLERTGVNPEASDNNGRTPLSFAASSGDSGAVRVLLRQQVNPNSPDNYGQTPLLWAARSGNKGAVGLLLGRETNPDASDLYSQTPLLWAARSGHEDVVKLLLDRDDLNPNPSNTNGRTPLSFAASSGYEGIVKLFLQRQDIDPDSPDNKCRTPLSRAAMSGHEGVVKQLLERGDVRIDSRDKDGRTPLSLAAMRGYEGVVKLLSQSKQLTPELPQKNKQTEQIPAPAAGRQIALSPLAPPRGVDISPGITDITDAVPLPRPGESRPNTPDPPRPGSVPAPSPAFWVSCGVFLLSVIIITRSQAVRKR